VVRGMKECPFRRIVKERHPEGRGEAGVQGWRITIRRRLPPGKIRHRAGLKTDRVIEGGRERWGRP